MNSILKKVEIKNERSFSSIIYGQNTYQFSEKFHLDNPEAKDKMSKGHEKDIITNAFDTLDFVFYDLKPSDNHEYIQIFGRQNNERTTKFIRSSYIKNHENLNKWKIFVPKANGSGAIGEVLSTPLIGKPLIGHTQTYISIGSFNKREEADAALKYIKSKFARSLLSILKITQDNPAPKWKYVPIQDFTQKSDIDWSKSIPEIDSQLYSKYELSQAEIDFIEEKVSPMK